ncbi:MAG: NB-ARC domain-containing protein [Minisyncoccia bacterium]
MGISFFIPDQLKINVTDFLVNLLADFAVKFADEQIAGKIKKLSSEGEFYNSVEKAINKGLERFVSQYTLQDEDLVESIIQDEEFLKSESIQIELVRLIRRPGAWQPEERNNLDHYFEDVLPHRVNKERVKKAVDFLLRCIVEELWTLPGTKEIREIYALQFQKISTEAVLEHVELAKIHIESMTQINFEIRQALIQLTTTLGTNLLNASPIALTLPHPKPYHNLPQPDYTNFIGRERELSWLRHRLLPFDRSWQIAITGIGGIGKSALALAIAREFIEKYEELPESERFDYIIWISAKEEVLTAQGREMASLPQLILRTLEDVYTVIARVMEKEYITRAIPEEQENLVEKALKEKRTLLVMDNLESVKDKRIKPFLRKLPSPTKAIITSREWLDVADILNLKGLSSTEADNLIIEDMNTRNINLDINQRQRIFELTAGLPLPIRLSIARMASGENFDSVERWLGNSIGDLPEYCIKGQIELVQERDQNSLILLLGCSLFEQNAGASRDALGYITNLSIADRDAGLSQLQRLFIVNRNEHDRFWVLPIVQRYSSAQFEGTNSKQIIDKWLEWLVRFAYDKGADLELYSKNQEDIENEYPHLLEAIRWCNRQQEWENLFLIAEGIWSFAYTKSLFHEFLEILNLAMSAAHALNDEVRQSQVHLQLARLYLVQHGHDEESLIKRLKAAEKIFIDCNNDKDLVTTWYTLSHIYFKQDKLIESEELAKILIKKGEDSNNILSNFWGTYRFSEVEFANQNFDEAWKWLDLAEKWAKKLKSNRMMAHVLHRRSAILIEQNEFIEAEQYILKSLELDTERKELRYIANDKFNIAIVCLHTERLKQSVVYARESLDLYRRLGMRREIKETEKFIQSIVE